MPGVPGGRNIAANAVLINSAPSAFPSNGAPNSVPSVFRLCPLP
jgi:hypothetical protein